MTVLALYRIPLELHQPPTKFTLELGWRTGNRAQQKTPDDPILGALKILGKRGNNRDDLALSAALQDRSSILDIPCQLTTRRINLLAPCFPHRANQTRI